MDKTSPILTSALDQFRSQEQDRTGKNSELGQDAFLNLMVTQLKNQDPMKPMESGDFLSQIAQFSTVNGISGLQKSFATLASSLQSSQALQASTMVGRDVVVPRDTFTLRAGNPAPLAAEVPAAASNVAVAISDANGQLVRHVALGPQAAGNLKYEWDGLRDNGEVAPPGTYKVRFDAAIDGQVTGLTAAVRARVDSVSLGRNGLPPTLNLDGFGAVDVGDVIEIM